MAHRVEIFDRVKQAHAKLLEGYSCTAVVTQLAESKGLSRRTAQRTVQQTDGLAVGCESLTRLGEQNRKAETARCSRLSATL